MIPVLLKLANFTSYGENTPELDFTKFHMAAISGQNGAGKSSLLDAITWALWGTSRAGDSSDQLVRLGETDMQVEFSFELDNHIYTVKRRRILKHGGSTALELWSGSHNLTEGTIKATQQKIISILHLTYETFTNSSFIRQGHAGEFTTKGPTDRKRILADILGLDHYDALEEKAKEKIKDAQTKLTLLEYQILEIEAELSQKEERQKALTLAELEAKKAEQELADIEKLIKSIDEEQQIVITTIKSLEDKKLQAQNIQKEMEDIKFQVLLKEKAKEEFQEILEQKTLIEAKYQKLQILMEEKKILDAKRSDLIKVKDILAATQKVLIEREEKRTKAITDIEVEMKRYSTENEQLQNQNKHLSDHKSTCPTCGQTIDDLKNKEIVENNLKNISKNEKLLKELQQKIEKYQAIVLPERIESEKLEIEVKKIEEETKTWGQVSQEILSLEKYSLLYTKLQQAETGVKSHLEAIIDLQKLIKDRQSQLEKSKEELENLNLFENKLLEVKQKQIAQESKRQELSQKALELRSQVGQAKQLMSRSEQMENLFEQKSAEKKKLNEEREIFEELALAFGKKGIQAMIIEQAIPEIEDEANRLLDKLTEGRMKVAFLTQKETKTKVQTAEGKVHATVETLDIIISDEMGERAYEMYSGGETFRVNFAIRLAISKLLAHRAGAKLQFLVIDEGFGTQDAPGRARLVEVLDTIKNDFEKIVIITHIEELKEEFPVRIEVSKNASSTFQVVGV